VKAGFDAVWKRRATGGDAGAVRLLAERVVRPLWAFCFYRVGKRRDLCEEVVQETLVRAIRDLKSYDPARAQGDVFGWVAGLARNEISRILAREKGSISLDALWARLDRELLEVYARLESDPFGDEVLRREETREMVNATMSQLPPHYREALEAKYVDGRSVRDIAAAQRTTEKAVESQLTRAREAFRGTFLALARNLGMEGAPQMEHG